MRIFSLLCIGLFTLSLSSCHFGRSAEEILHEKNNIERTLDFSFSASQPGGGSTRTDLKDEGLDGLSSRWNASDMIALFDFGEVFISTNGGTDAKALQMKLKQDESDILGIDYAEFKGQGRAKMGDGVFNGKQFALVFPYKKFAEKLCSLGSLELDFSDQLGTLNDFGQNFQYAWGYATGTCENGQVTLKEEQGSCSSLLKWHSHGSGGEQIILDNKMCAIRFSLIHEIVSADKSDTTRQTLKEFLDEKNLEVYHINVKNQEVSAPGISKGMLELGSGMVFSHPEAADNIDVIGFDGNPIVLTEIDQDHATPNSRDTDAEKVAWGSSFYLSVPCPSIRKLLFHPLLTILTRDKTSKQIGPTYYGAVSTKEMKEGNYYMTAPIRIVDNEVKLNEEAKIYLYYHSSFVWSGDDAIDIY